MLCGWEFTVASGHSDTDGDGAHSRGFVLEGKSPRPVLKCF